MTQSLAAPGGSLRILWDIDGTLVGSSVQSVDRHALAVQRIAGVAFPEDLRGSGKTDRELVLTYLRRGNLAVDSTIVECALAELDYITSETEQGAAVEPIRGARRALAESASRGWRNCVLTGNTPLRASLKLRAAGLLEAVSLEDSFFGDKAEDRFELVRASSESSFFTRDPVVLVGDTPLDIRAARSANVPIVAVATGSYGLDQLSAEGPTLALTDLVSGLGRFLSLLDSLAGRDIGWGGG